MKIVHVCMGFPVEYPGGITNYVRSLAASQSRKHNVTVICNGSDEDSIANVDYKIIRYNSPIKNFSLSIKSRDKNLTIFEEMLNEENADLYHFHSLLGIDIQFLEKWDKKNYIVSLHDYNMICPRVFMVQKNHKICREVNLDVCKKCVGFFEQIDLVNKVATKFMLSIPSVKSDSVDYRKKLFIRFLNNSKMCYPVSKRVGNIFTDAGLDSSKSKVITIGNESANQFAKREPSKSKKISVVFLGTFTKIKGAELLITLMSNLSQKKFEFNLYGRGDNKLIENFKKNGGIYHGSYNPNDLPGILSKSDLGVVLSIWEDNGPQVVMEMINNGIPVIGTKRGGIPDFIKHEKTGYIFDPDEEIISAIQWLDEITKEKIKSMMDNITPLKSPDEHYAEFESEFSKICNI